MQIIEIMNGKASGTNYLKNQTRFEYFSRGQDSKKEEQLKTQESNIRQLRIDGCGCLLTEAQIRHWIGLFADIVEELVEEAVEDGIYIYMLLTLTVPT